MSSRLICIVFVCKNPGPRLAKALESVWTQSMQPELVVIDGASNDGTTQWLDAHRSRLTTLVSETDKGVYEAMNKGVSHATAEWILFLGADDRLTSPTVLAEVSDQLKSTRAGVLVGEAVYDDGRTYRLSRNPNPLARNFVHHQASFYRRALFDQLGGFDTSLCIASDYEFNLRLWKTGVPFKPVPTRIAECASNGVSDGGNWNVYREEILVRHRYASAPRCWFWDSLSVVRWIRKKLVRSLPKSRA